jgi:hypothetical protein
MVVVVPMALVQLPPLPLVVIMRVVPVSSLVRWLIPAPCHPSVAMAIGFPIPVNPGVPRARSAPPSFVAEGRRSASDIERNLREGGKSDDRRQQQSGYPLRFHADLLIDSNSENATCKACRQHSGLGRRVFLPCSFDSRQHAHTDQHNADDDDPVRWHMRQDSAIDQAAGQDGKAGDVDCE